MSIDNFIHWLGKCIPHLVKTEIDTAEIIYKYFTQKDTVILSKELFTNLHSINKQRDLGISYTGEEIRQELVRQVLARISNPRVARFSDPCCGSGLFPITILEQLINLGVNPLAAIKQIHFADIDRSSVLIALANIYSYLERIGVPAYLAEVDTGVTDFLRCKDKYDAFITNPPYVKFQNLSHDQRKHLKEQYPDLFIGALGLSGIFLKKMLDDLCPHGVIGVITQNNLFTSLSAKNLRKALGAHLSKIDTFGDKLIFEDASAYTCLLYMNQETQNSFEYRRICTKNDLIEEQPEIIRTDTLDHSKWRLGSVKQITNIKNLENKGIPLGKACRIWVGIATQFDKAFTVYRDGKHWISQRSATSIEDEIVKDLIRVPDLSITQPQRRGVIYPYHITGDAVTVMHQEYLEQEYPNAYLALNMWKTELLNRRKGQTDDITWYQWGRSQSMLPVSDKLLTKTFDKQPNFYRDRSNSLFSNGYAVKPYGDFTIEFVQKVLHSKTFQYYTKLTSFEIAGGYQCYQKNFIERFCLPDISLDDQLKLVLQDNIDDFLLTYYQIDIFH